MSGISAVNGTNSYVLQDRLLAPIGTVMVFNQTTPPVGWAKGTTTDVALRVTNGTVGTGGSVAFETAFAAQTVPVHTLSKGEIPAHAHRTAFGPGAGVSDNFVVNTDNGHDQADFQDPIFAGDNTDQGVQPTPSSEMGGGSHGHGSIDLNVSYVDVIIATKA